MATVPNKDGFGGTDPHIDEPYGGTPIWGFTWNNPAVTWYGHRINITDTGSAADSKAIEVKRNGSSIFSVAKTGIIAALGLALSGVAAIAGGTVTANAPAIDASQTWNNGAVAFTGFKVNITDTASALNSFVLQLQVAGADVLSVSKQGYVRFGPNSSGTPLIAKWATVSDYLTVGNFNFAGFANLAVAELRADTAVDISATAPLRWGSLSIANANPAYDTYLYRDAANILAQRNGTNAQAFRVYNTYIDGSNYERGALQWNSNFLELRTDAAGTGTARSVRIVAGSTTFSFDNGGSFASGGGGQFAGAVWFFDGANVGAPGIAWTNETNSGFYRPGAGVTAVTIGGNRLFQFTNPSFDLASTSRISWNSSSALTGSRDVILLRDAASVLAQRDGTNSQVFRIYNTYTDDSNYERGAIGWGSNIFEIGTANLGTGVGRELRLKSPSQITFQTNATQRWAINTNGHFTAVTDNSFDIGASGANRPRNAYLGNALIAVSGGFGGSGSSSSTHLEFGAGTPARSQLRFVNGVAPTSPNNGDIWFDGTDLKMRIGGVTKTFTLT